jgi:hypothetical protein
MSPDELRSHVAHERYGAVYEYVRDSSETCRTCFGRVYTTHPEYDEAVNEALSGRKLGGKSALQVISATSTPSPETVQEVVPPRTDDNGRIVEKATPKTICETCGVVDHDPNLDRDLGLRMTCIDHIAAHLSRHDIPFNADAARDLVRECAAHDALAGCDDAVFRRATKFGLEKAELTNTTDAKRASVG